MDINVRSAVKNNFKSSSAKEIYQTIDEACKSQEEKVLPGLGVFLNVLWDNTSDEFKNDLSNKLEAFLK